MSNPDPVHWGAVRWCMRYVAGTKNRKLQLGPFKSEGPIKLIGFSDSDWAGDTDTRRSTAGYVFVLNDSADKICTGAISVNSRLQPTVALSSTEAEYMAACSATQEAISLRCLLESLGHPQNSPTIIYEDNHAAIALAHTAIEQWHPRTRHMDVRYKFVKERVRSREVQLVYVHTSNQLADLLRKNLPGPQFTALADRILGTQP
ncbi:unnamed protein product [Phaeothamnion confervicola]